MGKRPPPHIGQCNLECFIDIPDPIKGSMLDRPAAVYIVCVLANLALYLCVLPSEALQLFS